jgi:hypothetical protein
MQEQVLYAVSSRRPLPDSMHKQINKVDRLDRDKWSDEVDFIDNIVDWVDSEMVGNTPSGIDFKVKYMHSSPMVEFSGPDKRETNWSKSKADWINKKDCELADLLFLVNTYNTDGLDEHRVCISQSKFSKESDDKSWHWKVKMHQFYMLSHMSDIKLEKGKNRYDIERSNKSFTTYSMASNFRECFFSTIDEMRHMMTSTSDVKTSTLKPKTENYPYPYQGMKGVLKRLILSMYGQSFDKSSDLYKFLKEMFSEYSFEGDSSKDAITDGGVMQDPGMAVIQVEKFVGDAVELGPENYDNDLRI